MAELTDAIEAAINEALDRLKPWTEPQYGDLIAINALRAVSIAIHTAAPRIEAAARADERAKVGTQIAEEITITPARYTGAIHVQWALGYAQAAKDAAAVALWHAANGPESYGAAPAAHAESHRTSKPAETLSGHATQEGER